MLLWLRDIVRKEGSDATDAENAERSKVIAAQMEQVAAEMTANAKRFEELLDRAMSKAEEARR